MTPFTTLTARCATIDRANVDTDQIIPARFLRKPRSDGYQNFLFADEPEVRAAALQAGILLAGANFGCGSSREGAVYALVDAGIRCVIAPSFGDIFASNAGKNGLLLLALPETATAPLRNAPGPLTVDLPAQRISGPGQGEAGQGEAGQGEAGQGGPGQGEAGQGGAAHQVAFEIDPFRKRMLLEGLDDIGLTLAHATSLDRWAAADAAARPWAAPHMSS